MSLNDTSIIGMACYLPSAPDIACFWQNLLNPSWPTDLNTFNIDNDILEKVLSDLLEDCDKATVNAYSQISVVFSYLPGQGLDRDDLKSAGKTIFGRTCTIHIDATGSNPLATGLTLLEQNAQSLLILCKTTDCSVAAIALISPTETPSSASPQSYARIPALIQPAEGLDEQECSPQKELQIQIEASFSKANIDKESILYLETEICLDDWPASFPGQAMRSIYPSISPSEPAYPVGSLRHIPELKEIPNELLSIIKLSLSLCSKLIPCGPAINPSELYVDKDRFYVHREGRPWVHDNALPPRRALLLTGSAQNTSCAVIQEIDSRDQNARQPWAPLVQSSEIFMFSGKDCYSILLQITSLRSRLDQDTRSARSFVKLAHQCSQNFSTDQICRLAIVTTDFKSLPDDLEWVLHHFKDNRPPEILPEHIFYKDKKPALNRKIAVIFPGLGIPGLTGSYSQHLHELATHFPEARAAFDKADRRHGHFADPMPTNYLFFPPDYLNEEQCKLFRDRLSSPNYNNANKIQEERNLAALGVAGANELCWNILSSLKIQPDMFSGQSLGDLSALCAAGVIKYSAIMSMGWDAPPDANTYAGKGRLAIISTLEERLAPLIAKFSELYIAVYVTPSYHIVGGDAEQLEQLIAILKKYSIWSQRLPYGAVHTPKFSTLAEIMRPLSENTRLYKATRPVYSGMTSKPYPQEKENIRHIMLSNMDSPVLLWQTTRQMYQDGARIFIQSGGGATMHAQIVNNCGNDDVLAVTIDNENLAALDQLNHMYGNLVVNEALPLDHEYLFRYRNWAEKFPDPVNEMQLENDNSQAHFSTLNPLPPKTNSATPFIGTVKDYKPGESLQLERLLHIDEDLYLHDHLFVHAPGIKSPEDCLPVVPMTISIEIMAEAAACLAPGLGLVGVCDLEAGRWISPNDSKSILLTTTARCQAFSSKRNEVSIRAAILMAEQTNPAIEATFLFAQNYQQTLQISYDQEAGFKAYPLSNEAIYGERYLFHGPGLQTITSVVAQSETAIVGNLVVVEKNRMFASTTSPTLLTDPCLLDGVGQMAGLWAMDRAMHIVPIGLQQMEFYQPTPPVGTLAPIYVRLVEQGSLTLTFDIEVQNGHGGVWFRIKSWKVWVFRWTQSVREFRRNPFTAYPSIAAESICQSSNGTIVRMIDNAVLKNFDLQIMARFYFTKTEYLEYKKNLKYPNKARDQLLGRIAAKDAVRQWLSQYDASEAIHPASFEIRNHDSGQPQISGLGTHFPLHISLSHSAGRAIAVVSTHAVGVDVEQIEEKNQGFEDSILLAEEKDVLHSTIGIPTLTKTILAWAAKEAVSKLRNTGLQGRPKAYQIITLEVNESDEIHIMIAFEDHHYRVTGSFDSDFVYLLSEDTLEQTTIIKQPIFQKESLQLSS